MECTEQYVGEEKEKELKGQFQGYMNTEQVRKWVAWAAQGSSLQGNRIEQDEMRHDPKICTAL